MDGGDPLELVLAALRAAGSEPRRSGAGWAAKCPAHDDRAPSLSVGSGKDGRVLIRCQAGCTLDDVLDALGLAKAELFAARPERKARAELIKTYDYTDEAGELLFQVCRFSPKGFRQRRPDGRGGWSWSTKGVRRVLYRLPQVVEAVAEGRPVFVVEGERDADAVVAAGYVGTCNPGGAGKWLPEHADALAGAAQVVVVADKDPPGRAHALAVAESLRPRVGQVVVAEALRGKDVSDHLAAGYALEDLVVMAGGASATAGVLEQLCCVLRRFVFWRSGEQVDFVALWIAHTYVYELFDTTPYLDISSATKRSGKSRLLELLRLLACRAWPVTEPSEAVLFRKVHADKPTLLVDEVDATFGKDAKVTEGLRAIYNVGYRTGSFVPRCVGNDFKVAEFNVYCPKAFAGLDGLPDTVRDRSGRIELVRRSRADPKPERMRMAKVAAEMAPLVDTLAFWAASVQGDLRGVEPELPETLSDRAQDGVEALAAIADLAGEEWATRARKAFIAIMGAEQEEDRSVQLLGHIRDAFVAADEMALVAVDFMATNDLLRALVDRGDDSPWAAWWGRDLEGPDSKRPGVRLAQMLKPYGISPGWVGPSHGRARGYRRADFADVWERYVVQ